MTVVSLRRETIKSVSLNFEICDSGPTFRVPSHRRTIGWCYIQYTDQGDRGSRQVPKVNPCVQTSTTRCMARDTTHWAKELRCTDKSGTLC